MRKQDVPQDAALLEQWREINYAVDEDGRYRLIPSAGWDASNLANVQAWQAVTEAIAAALRQVRSGQASPLAFHMARHQMDVGLLAAYAGLARWRVRRHLQVSHYQKLSAALRGRYAAVFNIPMETLDLVPERLDLPAWLTEADRGLD
jgi:hypothetical protein